MVNIQGNTPFHKVLDESTESDPTCISPLLPLDLPGIDETIRVGVKRYYVAWWGLCERAIFLCELKNGCTRIVAPGFKQENIIHVEGDVHKIVRGQRCDQRTYRGTGDQVLTRLCGVQHAGNTHMQTESSPNIAFRRSDMGPETASTP